MRKSLVFIGGVVSGIILTIVTIWIIGENSHTEDMTLFESEGKCVSTNDFRVFQVLENGDALASEAYTGMVVLFISEENEAYYDDQIISIPRGKCTKQIGIFNM